MELKDILTIVSAIASFLFVTLIPFIVTTIKNFKAAKEAKTDAERQAIYNDMLDKVSGFIADAETTFKALDTSLKAQGQTGCGALKKRTVMQELQTYALTKGIEFDADYWGAKVDELVKVTKQVNAKEG